MSQKIKSDRIGATCCGKKIHLQRQRFSQKFSRTHEAICRCDVLLQLVAQLVHTEWSIATNCCCNLSPIVCSYLYGKEQMSICITWPDFPFTDYCSLYMYKIFTTKKCSFTWVSSKRMILVCTAFIYSFRILKNLPYAVCHKHESKSLYCHNYTTILNYNYIE